MSDKEQKSLEDRVADLEAKVKELEARLNEKASSEYVNRAVNQPRASGKCRRP